MTADDIIAANPGVAFRKAAVNGVYGLIATTKDGVEQFIIWRGDYHSSCSYPPPKGAIGFMKGNISRAAAHNWKPT